MDPLPAVEPVDPVPDWPALEPVCALPVPVPAEPEPEPDPVCAKPMPAVNSAAVAIARKRFFIVTPFLMVGVANIDTRADEVRVWVWDVLEGGQVDVAAHVARGDVR